MSARFAGLDRLKGIALWAMLLHHCLMWMVGDGRSKLGGDGGIAVTDLAAPMFAVAAGAGAELLARRLRARGGTGRALGRWAVIGAWGVVLGAVIDHDVDSVGVLETLAACGAVVMVVALLAAPSAAVWAVAAVSLTLVTLPIIRAAESAGGWWQRALADSFPIGSYLAMAAAGASVAALLRGSERQHVLDRVALGSALALAVLAVAGAGVWPIVRYPSGPAFVVPGVVASLLVWAVAARMHAGPVLRALERAGRRTLVVYVAHYAVRIVLDLGGWWAQLEGPGWTAAAVALAAALAAASGAPWRRERRPEPPSTEERDRDLQLAGS